MPGTDKDPTGEPSDIPSDDPDEEPEDTPAESRYKRRIGVSLALLAILGAWIAVMQTDAGTNESTAAREATRQAVEAQSADVLAKGAQGASDNARAEVGTLGSKAVFADPTALGESLGITIDPRGAEQRLENAKSAVAESLDGPGPDITALTQRANALTLRQAATVDTRITWNAKSSQYETVMTVLAIAVFLVGFTLVVGRRVRPPLAVPAILLALYCAGWAALIYSHDVPDVPQPAVEATAAGQTALGESRATDVWSDFSKALDSKPDYVPALRGRAIATLLETNPDLLTTMAVTDTSPATVGPALRDITTAIDDGGDQDPRTVATAALVATVAGRWERASTLLDSAIDLNETAAELYLWHAAVDVALGHPDSAQKWLQSAKERFGDLSPDRIRSAVAQYLSVLEIVAEKDPDRAPDVREFAQQVVAAATEKSVDRPLTPDSAPQVSLAVEQASFADNTTTVKFALDGVTDETAVAVVGYERPAPGAAWVQPPALFYAGSTTDRGNGVSIDTPQTCAPVEFRFDLYVEGRFVSSTNAPGGKATC